MAVHDTGHEIPSVQPHLRDSAANLRHIADGRISPRRRLAEDANSTSAGRHQTEDSAHQRGFAGAVRSQHADKLARRYIQVHAVQHDATAEHQADVAELDGVHGRCFGSD